MTSASAGRSNILMQWRKCWSIPRLYHHPRSQINIMSSTGTSRPLISPSASVPARSGFGFAHRWHLDLFGHSMWICAQNIYISRGFYFPYFRSSPLSISPAAEWHHIFLLNCPEKRTIFGTVCTSNSKEEYSRELQLSFPLEIGYLHLVTQICANRSSFWQNKGFVLHVCGASSDNRSWSLHLFTESTSGWKWTTSPTINSSECPPPWSCTSKLSNWSKSFSAKSTQNTPQIFWIWHILFLLIISWLPLTKVENCSVPNSPALNIPTS